MSNFFPNDAQFKKVGNKNGSMIIGITAPFCYLSSKGTIFVPAGFRSDGASIPRIFWSIFSPFNGDYFDGALIHDFLYSKDSTADYPDFTRADADEIFKEAMFNLGVGWVKRETIYRAVRLGGWASYKKSFSADK